MQHSFGRQDSSLLKSKTIFNSFLGQPLSPKTQSCFGGHDTSFTQASIHSKAQQATFGFASWRLTQAIHQQIFYYAFSAIFGADLHEVPPQTQSRHSLPTIFRRCLQS
ncbi:hypothetical protein FC093_23275 [Ilyomonas limi]|uniref:Uncharacterized protein n=1 Tax=Ilyomonas limi TaxID=2575867 RepID=A0A4U3KPU2_9BACT|nr:hypothetical protein [Ilyomonas limi]TKK64111.1 hypothetical protein FC093_23275 [Ilyomonas limi]